MEHTGAIAVGQLLVATEPGRGGFFDRTVILLISHNESGTIGLCLNLLPDDEATPGSPLAQVREHFGELLSPPGEVMIGGPVNPEVVVLLGEPVS
ncbi:MAG TPA: YqgE/AlgH family protein, partial [Arachnia sp.]|nr:YqgE/AlgH family protein [Propionibacteriaceae bacterium]HQD23332.1 YqgE/AlgH family protein [Arachnia sp.]